MFKFWSKDNSEIARSNAAQHNAMYLWP